MLKLETVCKIGKSFKVAAAKDDNDAEVTTAHLKFTGLFIKREAIDWILGTPEGWAARALFDEQGAPLARLVVSNEGRTPISVTGKFAGTQGSPTLALIQAELASAEVTITTLGALVEGEVKWQARGDEVEDVTDLLGRDCRAELQLVDAGQQDMLKPKSKAEKSRGRYDA